jgi:hypothetical protein
MFGIDDAIAAVSTLADDVVKRVWPDATEIEKAKLEQAVQEMQNKYQLILSQLEINKIEAANPSLFVSGWRPAVGWVCVAGMAYVAILEPLARFLAVVGFAYTGIFPVIDTTITSQILFGMLGLATARTVEKVNGVGAI